MAFLHFTYPYPDMDLGLHHDYAWLHLVMSLFCHGADGLPHCGDTVLIMSRKRKLCANTPCHYPIILAHASQSRHLLHTASCSLQEVQAVRTLSLSYRAMYPAGSCCNCAPHHPLYMVRPRAPLAHSHSLQAVPSLSLTISSVMSFPRRLVLHAERSP